MELEEGQTFADRYRIVRWLGDGSFGAVYEAETLAGGRRVALKVLHDRYAEDPVWCSKFQREARVTELASHPHVVQVEDFGIDATTGLPWMALELLHGETLASRLDREVRLPPALVASLFAQLGEAIGAAHRQGIIHSDLKPENLFLVGPSASPHLKVMDFGIARIVRAGTTSVTVSSPLGTPLYMAPEQLLPGERSRPATDVWSLGMIAFTLLTGAWYLRSASAGSVLGCVRELQSPTFDPASVRARELGVEAYLPAEFDRWFCHCVAARQDERFQQGQAAVQALLTLLPRAAPR